MAPNGERLPRDGPKRPSGQARKPRDGPRGFQDCPEGPNNGPGGAQWASTITSLEAKTTWASGAASQARLFLSTGLEDTDGVKLGLGTQPRQVESRSIESETWSGRRITFGEWANARTWWAEPGCILLRLIYAWQVWLRGALFAVCALVRKGGAAHWRISKCRMVMYPHTFINGFVDLVHRRVAEGRRARGGPAPRP